MECVPVIVGVRMSFALPVLFSAVRLYKRDPSRLPVEHKDAGTAPASALEPCWFADGGVCTSLPIHLFDKPMPRWPTFAVNLRQTHPDARGPDAERLRVWMDHEFANGPADGWLREWWKRIDVDAVARDPSHFKRDVAPREQLMRLLGAMFSTAIGWVDGAHLRLATCRDRVAHVCLDPQEGAFNVDTKPEAIRKLAEYGKVAGEKLVARFAEIDARRLDRAPCDPLHRRDAARRALHRRFRDRVPGRPVGRRRRARDRRRAHGRRASPSRRPRSG